MGHWNYEALFAIFFGALWSKYIEETFGTFTERAALEEAKALPWEPGVRVLSLTNMAWTVLLIVGFVVWYER